MASDTETTITQTRSVTERRYWRRATSPAGWWPWGLLPLLGLVLLFLYGALRTAPYMQSDVAEQVAQELRANGVDVLSVTADGQSAALQARATSANAPFIKGLAAATRCDTWYGKLTCPIDVTLALTEPAPVEPVVEAAPPRHHDFTFQREANSLTLRGEVPDEATRQRTVTAASRSGLNVIDQLTVSTDRAMTTNPLAINRALAVIQGFERGRVTWTSGVLRARGRVPSQAESQSVQAAFNNPADRPPLGGIDVQVTQQVDQCNQQFRDALSTSTIRFRTASAQIDQGNDALLKTLSEVIANCPGTLTISGHTDSAGDASANQILSEGRADAVRNALVALGVQRERLNTRGFGEDQPVADNATRAGRAQNRRIVIQIDELD